MAWKAVTIILCAPSTPTIGFVLKTNYKYILPYLVVLLQGFSKSFGQITATCTIPFIGGNS
jgi:hypothetical protein